MSFFIFLGFLYWLVASLVLRFVGQYFLNPENLSMMILLFVAMVPLMAIAIYPLYHQRKITFSERPLAAIYLMLPGMVLDVFSVLFFSQIFPNLLPEAIKLFSALLFWGYAVGFMTALIPLNVKQVTNLKPI
jgi:Family of unknown function (DUF5367)